MEIVNSDSDKPSSKKSEIQSFAFSKKERKSSPRELRFLLHMSEMCRMLTEHRSSTAFKEVNFFSAKKKGKKSRIWGKFYDKK